jgi:hypothetical protein
MYGVLGDTPAGQAWYDSIYKQYADWGVDFVKVDDMMDPYSPGQPLHSSEVKAIHSSILKTGRSILLSLSPGPTQTRDVSILNTNANMWRQVNDFWDTNGLSSMTNEFDAAYAWSTTSGITPGHWPDADMLPLGTIGNRACAFSHNQQVQVMTFWAIMPSPLIFGGMPTKLSTDSWTLALLTNEEVLAVNQDALGSRGKQISQKVDNSKTPLNEVWAKDLSGGRKAVALFNRDTQDAIMSVTFAQLDMSGTLTVRDLWHRADMTGLTTGISVNVPHESALMYTVSPPQPSGTGGNGGGAGGSSGNGGAQGGNSGGAGVGGAGGSGAAGGSAGLTGAGGAASGGRAGAGGGTGGSGGGGSSTSGVGGSSSRGTGGATTSGAGGASGGSTGTTGNQSSCSCALGARRGHSMGVLLVGLALVFAARVRRRKN